MISIRATLLAQMRVSSATVAMPIPAGRLRPIVVALCLTALTVSDVAAAQQATDDGSAELSVQLSADTVEVGDELELRLDLSLPEGRTVYFPDSLTGNPGFETVRPVEWTVTEDDGGAVVSITYTLMAFRFGILTIPEFAVLTAPTSSIGVVASDTGRVGDWAELEVRPEVAEALQGHIVPAQRLWVRSVLALEDLSEGLQPRPADDVVGASWNWIAVLGGLVFGGLLVMVASASARDVMSAARMKRAPSPAGALDPIAAARAAALSALDRLIGLGLHEEPNRTPEFYERSSGAVRTYVEHFDPAWGPAQTSTELMGGLKADDAPTGADPELFSEMHVAEVVKFGRLRPNADTAEEHWSTLREWVEESVGPDVRAAVSGEEES